MARVLVLGAGMVTRPLVRYLLEHGVEVTVASRTLTKAEALVAGFEKGQAEAWTTEDATRLTHLVRTHDVVVSMLPYVHHLQVARVCLEERKHLITTSYVKPEMRALDEEARRRGLLFLNEMGLDPGIDHMSAMRTIQRLEREGYEIRILESYGGALPAPEALDNPWGYKFSWSPRGVLLAATRPARFLRRGRLEEVSGEALFAHPFPHEMAGLGTFEVYPNGDAVRYRELYGVPRVHTLFRGTLRWPGWAETMRALLKLGYLSEEERDFQGLTYAGLLRQLTGRSGAPEEVLSAALGLPSDAPVIRRLLWAGLGDERPIPLGKGAPVDALTVLLEEKLRYREGERDMVILRDRIVGERGVHRKKVLSTLLDFGTVGKETAVARTVSLPAAIATRLLLEGRISLRGVWIPVAEELYEPVLSELQAMGMVIREEEKEEGAPVPSAPPIP